ncbi:MAG: chemotaxis protein [Gemmatimonadales bacterium]|nr:chemotaxis protein [Gemmatimonadales bacterium]
MAKEGILLESGTNEVELLEFILNGQSFGVNVLKVQAIEQFDPQRVTRIQLSDPAVIGTLLFRESCITLIDLAFQLRDPVEEDVPAIPPSTVEEVADLVAESSGPDIAPEAGGETDPLDSKLVLIMEFNDLKTAFQVDGVNRIHRVSWGDINPMSPFLSKTDSKFTGSIQIEGREVLIVDMEKILTEILPGNQAAFSVDGDTSHPLFQARKDLTIFLAEDSSVIRNRVEHELAQSNYTGVVSFANGDLCYKKIVELHEADKAGTSPIRQNLAAVISDIEMPAMDGLALCRNIKDGLMLRDIPVIMFSSLINDQIAQKCVDVGADDFISKPQFAKLVELLDKHCLEGSNEVV